MTFQIKNRFTGAVQFECELSAQVADESYSIQLGFAVKAAIRADANLAGADLAGADLARANLAGADLAGANLARAKAAELSEAQRAACNMNPASGEEIARLDAVREVVLKNPRRLRMDTWHSDEWDATHTPEEEHTCGSAHCIAGWLQALCPDPAIRELDPRAAGFKLAPVSSFMFFKSDAVALDWLEHRRYAESVK